MNSSSYGFGIKQSSLNGVWGPFLISKYITSSVIGLVKWLNSEGTLEINLSSLLFTTLCETDPFLFSIKTSKAPLKTI